MKSEVLLTKDNHLQFETGVAIPRRSRVTRPIRDFRDECSQAVREIADTFQDGTLTVLMSGGADSELIADAFRFADIPFEALLIRLNGDLNLYDICWAANYCEENSVPYRIVDFDVHAHFKIHSTPSKHLRRGQLFPSYQMIAKVVKNLNQEGKIIPIIGAGEPEFVWQKGNLLYYEYESDFSVYHFMKDQRIAGVPLFFEWSPELHASFILSKEIRDFVYNGPANYVTSEPIKSLMYWNQLGLRPRPKYNGFEKVSTYFPTIIPNFTAELESEIQYTEYSDLMKQVLSSRLIETHNTWPTGRG